MSQPVTLAIRKKQPLQNSPPTTKDKDYNAKVKGKDSEWHICYLRDRSIMKRSISQAEGGGRERRPLRIAFIFIVSVTVLALPSIYFSTLVSYSHEIADILHILSLDTTATTNTTTEAETETRVSDNEAPATTNTTLALVAKPVPSDKNKPLVAVVVCTKSNKDWMRVRQTSLHTLLIPSVEKTITVHDLRKYRVEFVIGFDKGDSFWENEAHRRELDGESIFPISFVSIPKDPQRPHKIPFNQLCRSAYEYGAEYIVRVNDDSEFKTSDWISKSVARLSRFNPPNLGVVGPTCKQGNVQILTHDFVHRTHLDIFNDYYPDEFDNWWIDDWISRVYGPERTLKMPDWEVFHHVAKHGTRYAVDGNLKLQLEKTLERGQKSIETFLKTNKGEPGAVKVLGTDRLHRVWGPMAPFHNPISAVGR